MARYDTPVATYKKKYDGQDIDTLINWARRGYTVKRGCTGELMYTNGFREGTATYFRRQEVRHNVRGAAKLLDAKRKERNARRRELAQEEKERKARAACRREAWRTMLARRKVVVFDCETSGLNPSSSDILSLSYQALAFDESGNLAAGDGKRSRDFYFDWPEDPARVDPGAIAVNGLTRERLAELGTSDMGEAIAGFAAELDGAALSVAHNADFDMGFIDVAAGRYGLSVEWPQTFDTMVRMTAWCGLRRRDGTLKWPRLSELAECLGVPSYDIDFHRSGADVELTARCLMKIASSGIVAP